MEDFIKDITVTLTKITKTGEIVRDDNETTSELGKAVLGVMILGNKGE